MGRCKAVMPRLATASGWGRDSWLLRGCPCPHLVTAAGLAYESRNALAILSIWVFGGLSLLRFVLQMPKRKAPERELFNAVAGL